MSPKSAICTNLQYMAIAHCNTEWHGPDVLCPNFEKFLLEIMAGDIHMVDFIQRLSGYCLSGLTTERVLPVLIGDAGQNGKGTLLETIADVLGDYAGNVPAEILLASSRESSGSSARPDLMQLRGKRFVWASETNKGRMFDAATAKWITGGDTLVCRPLYGQLIRFKQTAKIFLMTNHYPKVDGTDSALFHRLRIIEFLLTFVSEPKLEHERLKDGELPEKLLSERSGILAWLYAGFKKWREHGLHAPGKVKMATGQYKDENDSISQFITDVCLIGPDYRVKPNELFSAYQRFSTDEGLTAESQPNFFGQIKKRFQRERTRRGRWYIGIGLRDNEQQ